MSVAWNLVALRDAGIIQERLDSHHDLGFVPKGSIAQLSYVRSEPAYISRQESQATGRQTWVNSNMREGERRCMRRTIVSGARCGEVWLDGEVLRQLFHGVAVFPIRVP